MFKGADQIRCGGGGLVWHLRKTADRLCLWVLGYFGLQCLQVCKSPSVPWTSTLGGRQVGSVVFPIQMRTMKPERCDGMPKRGGENLANGVLNAGPSDSGCCPGIRCCVSALMTSSARVPTFLSRRWLIELKPGRKLALAQQTRARPTSR